MPDDLRRRVPEDPYRININQQWEVDYWKEKLGVSEECLKRAVRSVDPMVEDVKRYIRLYC